MSFSFSAGGTKAQTLDSLAKAPTSHDQAAATIADLLSQITGYRSSVWCGGWRPSSTRRGSGAGSAPAARQIS